MPTYREPAKATPALPWRGNERAALHELARERRSTLELGGSVIGVSFVALSFLGALLSMDTLALAGSITASMLASVAWLFRYARATHALHIIEIEGTLEEDSLGGFRVHAGDRRYRLFPLVFRHGYHASGPVKARVVPVFGAAIGWAPWPEEPPAALGSAGVSEAPRRAPIAASDRAPTRGADRP